MASTLGLGTSIRVARSAGTDSAASLAQQAPGFCEQKLLNSPPLAAAPPVFDWPLGAAPPVVEDPPCDDGDGDGDCDCDDEGGAAAAGGVDP